MGRLSKMFQRFPHRCTVYHKGEVTPFSEGERVVVWEGRCRKESNTSVRTFKGSDSVLKTDYRVQLGALVGGCLAGDADAAYDGRAGEEVGAIVEGIKAGMLIDIEDLQGNFEELTISDAYAGQLGTTVYCDNPKN